MTISFFVIDKKVNVPIFIYIVPVNNKIVNKKQSIVLYKKTSFLYNKVGGVAMKYSVEIGKIVEGALKHDYVKVINYTKQLIEKLDQDGESRAVGKFQRLLLQNNENSLSPVGMGSAEYSVPVDNESRTLLADIIMPTENETKVVLSESNNEKISAFVKSYQKADLLNSLGIGISNTLLLYGPPGCGKTKCAYLIAQQLGLPLVVARLDSLISSYLGTTAKNIRSLFEFAQRTPCVLFLDEFDAIAKARDDNNELGELKRVVNSLLQNVDNLNRDSLLIAATNHDYLLDSAVWRRFDYRLEIELPDRKAIKEMIPLFLGNSINITEKELNELSYVFQGLSGANIEEIIKKTIRVAVIENNEITIHGIYEELFTFKKIVPQNDLSNREVLKIKAKFLRSIDERIFSLQIIANILCSSKTTIQKLLKEESDG